MRTRSTPKSLVLAPIAVALVVAGCGGASRQMMHRGQAIPVIDGVAMSCEDPYELVQDCSIISGAKRVVKVDGLQFKVAGTADGRTVLAMPDKLSPSRRDFEVVYDKLEALARSSGAAVLKLEAVAAGPSVMGFVFTVDRDLYAELKARSLTR